MSLVDLLRASVERHRERPALVDVACGRTLSYATLLADVDRIAAELRAAGVAAPQRIGLVGANSPAYVTVAFGILAVGGCVVPIAGNLRALEQQRIVDAIDVNALVRVSDNGARWTFESIEDARAEPDGFAALDPAFVRFSSGTTADAKGVVLSHAATRARIAAADAVLDLEPADRVLWTLPLAHHFAATIPCYLGAGAAVLLAPEGSPQATAAALAHERATIVYASPVQLARLAAVAAAPRVPTLRLALSTAAPLAADVAARFEAAYGRPLGQAYGLIEAGLVCIEAGLVPIDAGLVHIDAGLAGIDAGFASPETRTSPRTPPGVVGRPVPGYEVAILDEGGAPVPTGARGEVGVRGPGLFDAYYAPWTPRAEALRGGWFATGDVGSLDAGGVLTLHGRVKSTIVVAGLKVFPEEVEEALGAFPTIAECRVFARAHSRLGELPHAEVVLRGATELDRDALSRHLALHLSPYKMPVDVTVVTAIPKTAGGKILRRS